MKIFQGLVPILVFWIRFACSLHQNLEELRRQQNELIEGTGETSLGGTDRLIPYEGNPYLSGANLNNNCPLINLPGIGVYFTGKTYTKIYICNNGMLRFNDGFYQLWPRNFGVDALQSNDPCLAPYWAKVDQNSFIEGNSKVYFKKYEDQDIDTLVFNKATTYGNKLLTTTDFTPAWVMVITWKDVRPLNPENFGGLNTFQVLITTDNQNSIAAYIYADIDWSVKALKSFYGGFVEDYPPVVGWNSDGSNLLGPNYHNFENSGNVLIEEIDDKDGNLGERGQFGIELGSATDESLYKCLTWYYNEQQFPKVECEHICPPTWIAIIFDDKFKYEFPIAYPEMISWRTCYINSFSPYWNKQATRCCYYNTGGLITNIGVLAGSSLRYHPIYQGVEEVEAKENCCLKNSLCGLYYERRSVCTAIGWSPPWWAFAFGDPHFNTLDGKNYTFNGCGWYTFFQGNIPTVGNSSLEVQVRTTKVGDANATAFTGIVILEGKSEKVQVNIRSNGGLLILIDGEDYGTITNKTTLSRGVSLDIINGGTLTISTPLGNGVRIKEAANGTFLTIITSFIQEYRNVSKGLSGYWNGDKNDDFLLPNGTILPPNISDSQIHFDFGESWIVQAGDELYVNVSDDVNFQCPTSFVPIFLDEALQFENSTLQAEAAAICGNDVTCLFDIAATGDPAIGLSTISQAESINKELVELENSSPYFTVDETVLNVTLGERFDLVLTVIDSDGDSLVFDVIGLPDGANFTSVGNYMNFTWLVESREQVNMSFTVSDGKNGTDTFVPDINLCACENEGTCFIPTSSSQITKAIIRDFVVMDCNCPLGKTGRYCESVKDFCESASATVCHPLVKCFNHPTNFTCDTCPSGYSGNGRVCSDTDECINEKGGCDQVCYNTAGSFGCQCNSGFTLNNDGRNCNDIDECFRPNDCAQKCNNTIGSYECYCQLGFKIHPNNTRECIASDLCNEGDNQCKQICYMDPLNPGQTKCACNAGYDLAADGKTCEDVDECASTETNLCDQRCTNTNGSYNCSCNVGFQESGEHSCSDYNECLTNNNNCEGLGEFCKNLIGSYKCECFKNWNLIRSNGSCKLKSDLNARPDPPVEPKKPSDAQRANAIQLRILDFQKVNWTLDEDNMFRDAVVKCVNIYCNENRLRPQDCGVSQNQLFFNQKHVQRLPGSPTDNGSDVFIDFYINYPNGSNTEVVPQAILASVIFVQLDKLKDETNLNLILVTPVTPPPTRQPTDVETNNAILLDINNFNTNQWTSFYESVFTRAVAITLNKFCSQDEYAFAECLVEGLNVQQQIKSFRSQVSFNQTHVGRLRAYPQQSGANVRTSFYVNYPNGTGPMPKIVLASILTTQLETLTSSLIQQPAVVTSAVPSDPLSASPTQTNNRVTVQIESFQASKWTYLDDLRFRSIVANRINSYCGRTSTTLIDCEITSGQASFSLSDVQRATTGTPSKNGNNVDLLFYVNYPSGSSPMAQRILASVIKSELNAISQLTRFTLILETSAAPLAPSSTPTNQQLSNAVVIKILDNQANEWTAIQDNRLRGAVAAILTSYCSQGPVNLLACNIASGQTSFDSSHVTRISSTPSQDGNYSLFADYPQSGSGPLAANLFSGILRDQLATIQNATNLQLLVQTSSAASSPPSSQSSQRDEAVDVVVSNLQANQWSAIQDNIFRGSVALAMTNYCNINDARREECGITGGQTSFLLSHVQRVQNSPSQDGDDAKLSFYVSYPSNETVLQEIMALVIEAQLEFLKSNTGLQLRLNTTIVVPPTPPPPTPIQNGSAIVVLLRNFDVNEWSSYRDNKFRENMAVALIQFCNTSTFHFKLCNITRRELLSFNASHIQRLPNSPSQSGSSAKLAFYANLPSGQGTVARNILSSVFISQQEQILSVPATIITSSLLPDSKTPSPEQERNFVAITILKFLLDKFTSLQEMDIKITVVQRLNEYCFSAGSTQNICIQSLRRRKRAVTNTIRFSTDDVQVISSSITASGNNTQLNISVTQPGSSTPISANVVQDALLQSFQQNSQSDMTGLTLALTNTPTFTASETANAIEVQLTDFSVSKWTRNLYLSFRQNLTSAIVRFCNTSDDHLRQCNISRVDLAGLTYLNVELLPNSPSQNKSNTILAFFVGLPSGSGTLPKNILASIFSIEKNRIFSQQSSLHSPTFPYTAKPEDSGGELVTGLEIRDTLLNQFSLFHVNDIKATIAEKLNVYCSNRSSLELCSKSKGRNFDSSDVHIIVATSTNDTSNTLVDFFVTYPGTNETIPANIIRGILSPSFESKILKLKINLDAPASGPASEDDDIDLPLILGLSIAGALIVIFTILVIVMGVYNSNKQDKYRDHDYDRSSMQSSAHGRWDFDRASPYSGSPFASIDAIPGFDEDGLPSENPAHNTQIY